MLKTLSPVRASRLSVQLLLKPLAEVTATPAISPNAKPSKPAIRNSLRASTLDGVFATIFSCVTAEVLLNNFLLDLGATSIEIGILAAIPMLANSLQPLGAYLADKKNSRRNHILKLFVPSRLLWLMLVLGIAFANVGFGEDYQLVYWTLVIALAAHIFGALGSASWLSWMAVLVPQRLRGRYFGLRNSAVSLTNLVCIPLLGLFVARWGGGTIQGYGFILIFAVVAGVISLGCQLFMVDVNPLFSPEAELDLYCEVPSLPPPPALPCLQNRNFLKFLLYYGLLMFSFNLSAPFFNIYLLEEVGLDISRVTLYASLTAGANLLMLLRWGKLADRVGNRPILLSVGIAVALTPLLWLGTGNNVWCLGIGFPLLYLLLGGTWSAMELCNNNIQMAIAPTQQSTSYFAIAAAIGGLGSALGMVAGGFLAQCDVLGGFLGLFALSAVLRLLALLPLIFVREKTPQVLSNEKV